MSKRKIDYAKLIRDNQRRWEAAKYHSYFVKVARKVAKRLCAPKAKAIYMEIQEATGVPWWFVAIVHEREASQRWDRNIAQGDPWNARSRHVPAGRGPFPSFKAAAVDALVKCHPYVSKWKDWTAGGALTIAGLYNGVGYELYHHMASPYLWSGTDQYVRGKYVRDHVFDPNEVDKQLGVAVIFQQMKQLDDSVAFAGEPRLSPSSEPPGFEEHDPADFPDPVPLPTPDPRDEEPEAPLPDWLNNPNPPPPAPTLPNPDVHPYTTAGKSVFKSKISWVLGLLGVTNAGTLMGNGDVGSILTQLVQQPNFLMMLVTVAAVGAGVYFYWKDHGKGRH